MPTLKPLESGAGTETEKLRHFRAFWAGGAPFIGEVGARGWAASLTAPGKTPSPPLAPILPLVQDKAGAELWDPRPR